MLENYDFASRTYAASEASRRRILLSRTQHATGMLLPNPAALSLAAFGARFESSFLPKEKRIRTLICAGGSDEVLIEIM